MKHDEYVAQREAKDPEFAAVRADLDPRFELARAMIDARAAVGLSQAAFAERLGMKQPQIARLESGEHPPRLETLMELAAASGGQFVVGPGRTIRFQPLGEAATTIDVLPQPPRHGW